MYFVKKNRFVCNYFNTFLSLTLLLISWSNNYSIPLHNESKLENTSTCYRINQTVSQNERLFKELYKINV